MPEKTPGEPNFPSRVYQSEKFRIILLGGKYPCLENPKNIVSRK
jgi:hypothetical protein